MNGSAAAIFGQKVVLGGGAPVNLNSLVWPSSSSIMASSICLASFLRSAGIDFGIAQPQISSHAKGFVRLGPSGKRAAATLPATLDLAGGPPPPISPPRKGFWWGGGGGGGAPPPFPPRLWFGGGRGRSPPTGSRRQ